MSEKSEKVRVGEWSRIFDDDDKF